MLAVMLPVVGPLPATVEGSTTPTEVVFKITGGGNAHGVGMSQRGARGRALAGQGHDQILAFYSSDHSLVTRDTAGTDIRVLLADDTPPTAIKPIRILARSAGWTSTHFSTYTQPFPANSYLDIVGDGAGGWIANVHDSLGVVLDSAPLTSALLMEPAADATLFEMNYRDNIPRHNLNRGRMRVIVRPSGLLRTVNIVNIEDYARGVVACEMPSTYPVEALRAQAIASRSYGMNKIKPTGAFDVYSYSLDQVYGGVSCEAKATNAAVADTTGKIVVDRNGVAARTIFHDTAGGHTESAEFAWPSDSGQPGTKYSYLTGRADVDAKGVPYEAGSSALTWDAGEVSMSQLSAILAKSSKTNVGTLLSFEFSRGVSGRVYKAVLTGTAGTKSVSGGIFKNVYNNHTSGPTLRSTLYFFEPIEPVEPPPPAVPTVPQNVQAVARDGRYVDLSWDASAGLAPITYRVFRDGTGSTYRIADNLGSTSFTDRPAEGTHYYTVRARDGAGNLSDHSVKVTVHAFTSASIDTTPPVVGKPGVTLRSGVAVGTGSTPIRIRASFTATDAGGVAATALQLRTNSGSYSAVTLPSKTASAANVNFATHNTTTRQFRARATDKAGNVSSWSVGDSFRVLARQDGTSAVSQTGSWTKASNSKFYGGSVRHSSSGGASQSWTGTVSSLGLVSTLGPNRGRAEVWVDGVKVATLDLYASSTKRRQVVYAVDFGDAGKHTIELRVSGTKSAKSSGKRVDFDAFIAIAP